MEGIVYINIENLFHHPDNPRKDIGDVTELAESVKKKGVMQNLTIIPACALTAPPEEQPAVEDVSLDGEFLVLIGNRRMEASKKAGIESVPCRIVSQIDKRDQVSIMLEENMQRSDLTITEQAEGFQMMLDLGGTVEGIKEKTGFSKSTIYHRLNIAKLDGDTLREKEQDESFQLSIMDLQALEKVKDIDKRNEILKNATDSANLKWKIESAVREEERKNRAERLIEMLSEMGIAPAPEEKSVYSCNILKSFHLDEEIQGELGITGDLEGVMYAKNSYTLFVIKEREEKTEESPEEIKRKQLEQNKKRIDAIVREMRNREKDLIKGIIYGTMQNFPEETPEFRHDIWSCLKELEACVSDTEMYGFFGKSYYQMVEEEREPIKKKIAQMSDIEQQLVLIYESEKILGDMYDYYGRFQEEMARKYIAAHKVFQRYGWNLTEDEKKILDGTHELYAKETDS